MPSPSSLHVSSDEEAYKLHEKLTDIDLQNQEDVVKENAAAIGLEYISLKGFPISPSVLGLIEEPFAKKARCIAFFKTDREIRIAVVDPNNTFIDEALQNIKKVHHEIKVIFYLISDHSFEHAMKLYKAVSHPRVIKTDVVITQADLTRFQEKITSFEHLEQALATTENMTDIFVMMVASALNSRASDIHVEAEEEDVAIRFRVDGVLHTVAHLQKKLWPKVISRIKVVSGLKINITDTPQDGRITIALEKEKMDIRVSTLPTAYGESVVMRLLRSSAVGLQFEDLGVRGKALKDLSEQVGRPNGMIITTGPTGSGKTTTLYAILNKLNTPDVKIITLEDPVEYKLKGIAQSQIDHSHDYTFAKGLRAILRQDPDIVMVGEIRDLETADISIQAALTGHLVLSTIHTNDAAGAVPRFLSMGTKPFLLAPALNAIIGQRLVRKICESCKEEMTPAPDVLEKAKKILGEIPPKSGYTVDMNTIRFYKGKGCEDCHSIGYKGRIGIYEIFSMNKDIEKIILAGDTSEYKIREATFQQGMITMAQDGLLKALDGITSVEEVFAVAE